MGGSRGARAWFVVWGEEMNRSMVFMTSGWAPSAVYHELAGGGSTVCKRPTWDYERKREIGLLIRRDFLNMAVVRPCKVCHRPDPA